MIQDTKLRLRLQFLSRVVRRECFHLAGTDQRLFDKPFSAERAKQLDSDPEQAERVEAFVGRLGRLQDTIGGKLLPLILIALGETPATMIDNLDRAERLDLIKSTDDWLTMRKLRNQMVHELSLIHISSSGRCFKRAGPIRRAACLSGCYFTVV